MASKHGRISPAQRIRMQNQAERELKRYDDHPRWFKHVCGIDLDPLQILRMDLLDQHRHTVSWDARRMRKSTTVFLHALRTLAMNDHEEQLAVTPREKQALKAMREYQLDMIRGSEILTAWIDWEDGRRQLSDTRFQFANKSLAWCAGISGQIDGSGVTYGILDELEDMPFEPLTQRLLPMLGQTQKLGSKRRMEPQLRALGVIKGSGLRKEFIDQGFFPMTQPNYPNGPVIGDVHMGIELGILDREWIEKQRTMMAPQDFIMQMLCREVASQNVIHLKWARRAMQLGAKLGGTHLGDIAEPLPGQEYRRHGLVALGYDHLGHADHNKGSRSALVIAEQVGEHIRFPFVKSWDPWEDETTILHDLVSIWRYFRPDVALGDALGVGLITAVNDELYKQRLTTIDRHAIGQGESTSSTWSEWAFQPLRFLGETKHKMAEALRMLFQQGRAVIPWFDDYQATEGTVEYEYGRFLRQLTNVKAVPAKNAGAYPSYQMDDRRTGDDYFDAAMAAVWGITTRTAETTPVAVLTSTVTRAQMLGTGA